MSRLSFGWSAEQTFDELVGSARQQRRDARSDDVQVIAWKTACVAGWTGFILWSALNVTSSFAPAFHTIMKGLNL